MEIKIYENINECRKLWEKFSPKRRLFDSWDFRQCFYNKRDNTPFFIAVKDGAEILGVVPLCFVKSTNQYNYVGGWFPERNSFFIKDKELLPQLLQACPDNTVVEAISPDESRHYNFLDDEYTYYIDLPKYDNSFEKYFSSFDRKKQKNIKREIRNMPKYKVNINRLEDFDRMVELNIRQFDEESIYNDKAIRDGIRKLVSLAHKTGILQMLSIEINGRTEAVDIGVAFGEWYHVVTGSSNNQKISNIGKLITILDIKNAIAKKARYVDFLASSAYWKNQWNFEREMLLKFVK